MDKLRILQSVKRTKIMDNLDTDEIRLYLILLANSGENGDGKILLRTIDGVFGDGFSRDRLDAASRKLVECGMIEVLPLSLEKIKGNNPKLLYKIFPVKQRQGSRFFSDSSSLL